MTETPDNSHANNAARASGVAACEVDDWFAREVLPLEAALMQFLQHNWRNRSDIADLRQDVYVQVYEAALSAFPDRPRQFLFTKARNLLINRVRREQIVPIEAVADLDALEVAIDAPGADRVVMARDELRRLQAALERLPPRCREVVIMGQIEELSGREIAARLGIAEGTVSEHLAKGMRALADILYGEPVDLRRQP
jgi:RNA polymerase sigma factor (sigma-70 family)